MLPCTQCKPLKKTHKKETKLRSKKAGRGEAGDNKVLKKNNKKQQLQHLVWMCHVGIAASISRPGQWRPSNETLGTKVQLS